MQIETTHEADVICKDLIGEQYKVAYHQFPDFGGFRDVDALWVRIEEALGRKGALDLCTTGAEDSEAEDILKEVFEEASQAALEDGHIDFASGYVDYRQLWERLCAVLGVTV